MQLDFTTFQPKQAFARRESKDEQRPRLLDERQTDISTKDASSYLAHNMKGLFSQQFQSTHSYQQSMPSQPTDNLEVHRQNHRVHHSEFVKQSGVLDSSAQYLNSKSYNLEESASRLNLINQRLKQQRSSRESSPMTLHNELDMLRNALQAKIDKEQLGQFLHDFSHLPLKHTDLYAIAVYAHTELSASNERQTNDLKNQVQEMIDRIDEIEQEKCDLMAQIESMKHTLVAERAEKDLSITQKDYLLAENERLLNEYRSYKERLETKIRQEEEIYRSQQKLRGKENQSPTHETSDRKYQELQTQFNSMLEKIRKDEFSIKQLQDINFKLMLEVEEKSALELKIASLKDQNQDLRVEIKDLAGKIDEQRGRAERERDGKQSEFKQVFEELSRCRSELRVLKDENSWLSNQKVALEEQYQKTVEMYNEVVMQRKCLLDEKDELMHAFDTLQQEHHDTLSQQESSYRTEMHHLQAALQELETQHQAQQHQLEEQGRTIKKYKKAVLQIHETVLKDQVSQRHGYESLNEDAMLLNLQPAIANIICLVEQHIGQQEGFKVQEEERAQVIYDLQNQLADLYQQFEQSKGVNEKLEQQYQQIKDELNKQAKVRKTLRKEYQHQKQVAEQCVADLNAQNEFQQQLQAKLKAQYETIKLLQLETTQALPNEMVHEFIQVLPLTLRSLVETYFHSKDRPTSNAILASIQQYLVANQGPAPDSKQLRLELQTKLTTIHTLQAAYDELMNDYKRVCKDSYGKMKLMK